MNTLAELRQAGKGTLHAAYNGVCIELNAEDGRCSVDMTIYRGSSDEELFNKMIESCYTYSKESTMHPISAPSDWTMVDHVVSDWESSFRLWAKRTIKL